MGNSDSYGYTKTVTQIVSDLRALQLKAKLRGPFVLGGASLGGLIVRSYAVRYPKQTAGAVFFDSVPDDWGEYLGTSVLSGNTESVDITAAAAKLSVHDKLGSKPLIVLEAGDKTFLQQVTGDPDIVDYWHPQQLRLAKISSNSIYALAIGSPHWIQSGNPNLSAEAIRLVVSSVRSKKPLPFCSASRLPRLEGSCEQK